VTESRDDRDLFRGSIFHLMRIALQEHQARWTARMGAQDAADYTKPQYALLRAVHEHPGLDQSRAVVMTGTDKATTAALVERLHRRGLLDRTVDETDRRRRLLRLTEAGEELVQTMIPITDEVSDGLLARLTFDERRTLLAVLAKLTDERAEQP
jgi:MarR family transcriptional regulator, temperature-dependent positive regulator of motility